MLRLNIVFDPEVYNLIQLTSLVVLAALRIPRGFFADGDAIVFISDNLVTLGLLLLIRQLSTPLGNALWALRNSS